MPILSPSVVVRAHFAQEHRELESVCDRIVAMLVSGDREGAAGLWSSFDDDLSKHFDIEERTLIPRLVRWNSRSGRALLEDHRYFRTRLLEFRSRVVGRVLRVEDARGFIDELRAHVSHEADVICRWADDHFSATEQDELLDVLNRTHGPHATAP